MARPLARMLRASVVGVPLLCAVALCVQDACVLAEPSGALPRLPDARPTIVHASVVPTESAVMTTFPASFIVPVELIDPTADIVAAGFIDYNAATGAGRVTEVINSHFEAANTTGRTRVLEIPITPPDPQRCHVIEIVVALRFDAQSNDKSIHTPGPPGGDIATWFYNASGDPGGCPSLGLMDASVDAAGLAEGGVQ